MVRRKERVIWAASGAVIALALIFVFSFGITKAFRNRAAAFTSNAAPELPAAKDAPLPEQVVSPVELSNTFRQVAKLMKPAVVNISTVQKVKATSMGGGMLPQIPGFQ